MPDPFTDRGPDPHMNLDGVRLTGSERRRLAIVAMLVVAGLALAIGGIAYGLPSGGVAAGTPEVVVGGSGRAEVRVAQDGAVAQRTTVTLPHTVSVDRGTTVVAAEVRPLGTGRVVCAIRAADGTLLDQASGTGIQRCGAQLR